MAQKDIGNKVPLHTLKKVEDVAAYYDEWALNNKYDKDMEAWNYTGPKETSETFNKYQKNKNIEIFDAGCGTGLVAVELKKMGYQNFYGADISEKLLVLHTKWGAPLSIWKKFNRLANSFAVVLFPDPAVPSIAMIIDIFSPYQKAG